MYVASWQHIVSSQFSQLPEHGSAWVVVVISLPVDVKVILVVEVCGLVPLVVKDTMDVVATVVLVVVVVVLE